MPRLHDSRVVRRLVGLRPRGVQAVALAALVASPALAADGSWSVDASGNYSDPLNWAGGVVPGSGGVARFGDVIGANRGVVFDISPTLDAVVLDSAFAYLLQGTGPLNLGGGRFDVLRSAPNSPTQFVSGHVVSVPIAGAGGLRKTGPGTLTLSGTNTYSGPTIVDGGVLQLNTGDAALGAAGQGLFLNGSTLRPVTAALATARPVTVTGSSRVDVFATTTFDGAITGSGGLTFFGLSNNVVARLNAANSFAGPTVVRDSFLLLDTANGSLAGSPVVDIAGIFGVESLNGVNDKRFAANAQLISRGSRLAFAANASTATDHAVPRLTLASGRTELLLTGAAATVNTVTIGTLERENRSTLFLRGVSNAATGASTVVTAGNAIATIGGGGAAGSTSQSIVPWMIGNAESNQFNLNNTFVTFDATTGRLRPLNVATEYATSLATAQPTDNVRLAPTVGGAANPLVVPADGVTVNSLIVANQAGVGNALTVTGANPIRITSGALTATPTNSLNSTTFRVPIDFGAAEGVLHNQSGITMTFDAPISGSNGLTVGGTGLVSMAAGAVHTYTGQTTLLGGTVQFLANVTPNQPGPFGVSDSAIVMGSSSLTAGGGASARILANGRLNIDRDIVVKGNPTRPSVLGTVNAFDMALIANGDIRLEGDLGFEHGAASGAVIVNGDISGPHALTAVGTSSGLIILRGNNTYTGGTNLLQSSFLIGSDNALGTGPIYFSGTGNNPNAAGPRITAWEAPRTLANDVVLRGNLIVGGATPLTITGTVNLGGGAPATGGTPYQVVVPASGLLRLTGTLIDGGVNKINTGTLELAGANTYRGGTTVTAGTLLLTNTAGSATGAGAVSVLSTARLGGNGTASGAVSIADGGILDPGPDLATLTLGSLVLSNASSLLFDLAAGSGDRVAVVGNLTLDGLLSVTAPADLPVGRYTLFTYGGTLTDNLLQISSLPINQPASVQTDIAGQVDLVVVPEPGTATLALLAAAGLLARRRRG